jgi:hypothetical protein
VLIQVRTRAMRTRSSGADAKVTNTHRRLTAGMRWKPTYDSGDCPRAADDEKQKQEQKFPA